MRHGDTTPLADPEWLTADDPDLLLAHADMHTWALANEQNEDDPVEEQP